MKRSEQASQYRMNKCPQCQLYFLDISYPQQREQVLYDIRVAKEQMMKLKDSFAPQDTPGTSKIGRPG